MELVGIVVALVALVVVVKVWNRSSDYIDTKLDEATSLAKLDARMNLKNRIEKAKKKYGAEGLESWDDLLEQAEGSFKNS